MLIANCELAPICAKSHMLNELHRNAFYVAVMRRNQQFKGILVQHIAPDRFGTPLNSGPVSHPSRTYLQRIFVESDC